MDSWALGLEDGQTSSLSFGLLQRHFWVSAFPVLLRCPSELFLPTGLSTLWGRDDAWSCLHCPTGQPTSASPALPLTPGQEAAKYLGYLMPAINLIMLSLQEKEEPLPLGWTVISSSLPTGRLCSCYTSCNGRLCY